MIDQLFKVATEFRFEIGSAMLGTQALQGQVEKLSGAVDNTIVNFQKLGMGFVANLGLGGGGLLGILKQSVSAWEDFRNAQLSFVNTISANKDKLTGPIDTFNERLAVSKNILGDIAKVSREWGLPQKELLNMTKLLAPMLVPEGLAGTNFKGAVDLSRKFLKAAPSFGVSPEESTFQLQSAIGGRASLQQTLFQRLTVETQAMREFAGQTERFNKLAPDKRFKLINEALDQFSSDTGVLAGRVELITTQIQRLKEVFIGVGGILLPLGEIVNKLGSDFLKRLESTINVHGRAIVNNMITLIKPLATSVDSLIVNALQLKELSGDVKQAGKVAGVVGIFGFVTGLLGISFSFLKILKWIAFGIAGITGSGLGLGVVIWKFGLIGLAFRALGFILGKVFLPLAIILTALQLFSRASAYAKVNDLKQMPELTARASGIIAKIGISFQKILWPFTAVFDAIAKFISPVLSRATYLKAAIWIMEQFASGLEDIAFFFVSFYGVLVGIGTGMVAMIDSIKTLDFANMGTNMSEAFMFGYEQTVKSFNDEFASGDAAVVQNVQNFHGGIKIENKFKENQEPDRIAFTMIEQLSKAGRNKTQAANMSFKPAQTYVAG